MFDNPTFCFNSILSGFKARKIEKKDMQNFKEVEKVDKEI